MNDTNFKYLSITVPVSEADADDLRHGEEFAWVFHTAEEPNTIIKVRLISEEKHTEEEEILNEQFDR
jgi:hypothetical protein